MNEFTKVFDIADSGYRSYGFMLSGLFFILIGLFLVFGRDYISKLGLSRFTVDTKFSRFFKKFFLCFSIFWTFLAFSSTFYEYIKLSNTSCSPVEGYVENYVQGAKSEAFTVSKIRFNYSDYVVTNGFNNMAILGGPIRQGLYVKICYVGYKNQNLITRLEIKNFQGVLKDYSNAGGFFSK